MFLFPGNGIHVDGTALLLAIDNAAMPLSRNLCLYLTPPAVRPEAVLLPDHDNPDAPDNGAAHFYGGVTHDGKIFRMWYYACHWEDGGNPQTRHLGNLVEGPTCYAESVDGLHWTKPHLGQVEWRGSRANNIIALSNLHSEGVHVIRDDRDPDPARRYKMVYNYWPSNRDFWTIRTAVSPDGLHWTEGIELPFDGFIEQASLYEFGGMYYVSGQMLLRSEGGHPSGRQGYAIVSPDFDTWLPEYGESFLLPEPADPAARGLAKPYEQVHIGVGATSFGNVAVGLFCPWHNAPNLASNDWFGTGTTSGDFGLLVSNDGLHFREPVKGHVWLHRDASPATVPAGVRHNRILCQGNGILNVGDETHIYHGRWANTEHVEDYHAEIALATLPRDRWGARGLFPDAADGSLWTAPVTLPAAGATLTLNAAAADLIDVEVADARFAPIPGMTGAGVGEGLDCPVRWTGRTPAELGGQTVRFRLRLRRQGEREPRVYAIYLR
jgi:hypothetical protein